MDKYNTKVNFYVGLLFLLSVIASAFLAINNSSELFSTHKYYQVKAFFADISGLNTNSKVTIAGVQVGKVSSIALDKDSLNALVVLDIDKNISLTADTSAMILTSGLLGSKYIGLMPGSDEEPIKAGEFIEDTQSSVNLESLISKFVAK